jgi:predicted nucleotidyltransferase
LKIVVTGCAPAFNSLVGKAPRDADRPDKLDSIAGLAQKHGVARLSIFGSGVSDDFDRRRSDLDFLVEFKAKSPSDHADSYFGLMEDLEALLGLPIDLIEPGPISSPYFREEIERTRNSVYEAG